MQLPDIKGKKLDHGIHFADTIESYKNIKHNQAIDRNAYNHTQVH